MPYIGNNVQTQGFTPAIDYFSGNGVTVTFTLSRPVVSVAQMIVSIDNVIQNPSSAYTVSGNSITFTSAPLSGTNNIWVEYTSLITTYNAISQSPSVIGDITASGGYLAVGNFGNSYIDGTIVDYVTGNARITTGPIDNMTFYHGGTAGRSEMMKLSYAGNSYVIGNVNIGDTTSPGQRLQISNSSSSGFAAMRMAANSRTYDVGVGGSASGFQQNNWYVYDVTGAATRFVVDASGNVTAPTQPSFFAYMPNTVTFNSTGGWAAINSTNASASWSIQHNVGSNFNASNGRFTAPVTGRYEFNFVTRVSDNQGADKTAAIQMWVNGSQYLLSDLWGAYAASYGGVYRPTVSGSVVAELAAGDYVNIAQFNASGSTLGFYQVWFSGRLLG